MVWGDRACAFRLRLPAVEVDGSSEPPNLSLHGDATQG